MPTWLRTLLHRAGLFFSQSAWLSLFTLLMLMGLVFGLAGYVAKVKTPRAPASGPASAPRGLDGAVDARTCGEVLVIFAQASTLAQTSGLLRSLDAVLVYGPDENDSWTLRVRPESAAAVVTALRQSGLVVTANTLECR